MIRRFLPAVAALLAALCGPMAAAAENIVPAPRDYEKRNGVFTILTTTKITHYPELRSLAKYLAEYLPLSVREYNGEAGGDIVLRLNKNLADEEYRLSVSEQGIVVEGGAYGGAFNGVETLLQLLPAKVYSGDMPLPAMVGCCVVADAPRFAYRGFMLDVCRTWMTADEVKRFVSVLAHHKINKLHLHLSDDEGWRVEILSHPELAEVGGFRGGGSPVAAIYGKWGERYGGYYTQQQLRDIVSYAAQRNIEIIPEIDLPGHSRDMARVMPEVLCGYTPSLSLSNGYDTRNVLCAAKESNYDLLKDILGEIASIFPSQYLHIGGDEVDFSQWMSCPDCKALMQAEGLTGGEELQAYFMGRAAAIIEGLGKVPCVWNEAVAGGRFTRASQVYGWESIAAARKAAADGYPTVVMPGQYFYFDMRQSRREDGHIWAAIFDARQCYSFDFAEQGFTADEMRNVLGVEASFFSELYLSHRDMEPDYLYYMTYPRICSLSEVGWCDGSRSWDDFYGRLTAGHYSRLAAMGVGFRLFPPKVAYAGGVLTASTDDRSRLYYTVIGEDEGTEHEYTGPIATDKPQLYAFRSRFGGAVSPEAGVEARFRMSQPKVAVTSSIPPSTKYPYTNAASYDGRIAYTGRTCMAGDWILFTFEEPVRCRRMEIRTGYVQLPRNIFEEGYMEVSEDGETFRRVCDLENGIGVVDNPRHAIKAVRVVSTKDGNGAAFVTLQSPWVYPVL